MSDVSPEPYYDEDGLAYYSRQSYECAKQTKERAKRKSIEAERERLLRLGADPAWVERVLEQAEHRTA